VTGEESQHVKEEEQHHRWLKRGATTIFRLNCENHVKARIEKEREKHISLAGNRRCERGKTFSPLTYSIILRTSFFRTMNSFLYGQPSYSTYCIFSLISSVYVGYMYMFSSLTSTNSTHNDMFDVH
jgi:hypothetical protein